MVDDKSANDEVFCMFGDMLGQDVTFMRQWMRCSVLTHHKFVSKAAGRYLLLHSLKLPQWVKELNSGCKADTLALFLLCIATNTHCFVHITSSYWTTLAETLQSHIEYSQ